MRDWMRRFALAAVVLSGCGGESVGVEPADAALTEPPVQAASKRPCPALIPIPGTPCSLPQEFNSLFCEYGTNEDFECNLLASCTGAAAGGDDRWVLEQPPPDCRPRASMGDVPLPADCPSTRPHIGDVCDRLGIACWYPETPWPLTCERGVWWPDPPQ